MRGGRLPALVAACGLVLAGCGSSSHFANRNRPPTPVDLTVYVNDQHISVSPTHIGAGPVIFYITNQASKPESLTIAPSGTGQAVASTAPINPGSAAQVQVDFKTGDYVVKTNAPIPPATLHIGAARQNADNVLLQP